MWQCCIWLETRGSKPSPNHFNRNIANYAGALAKTAIMWLRTLDITVFFSLFPANYPWLGKHRVDFDRELMQ